MSYKVGCCGDFHGELPVDIPQVDLLIIAGDICPNSNSYANNDCNYQSSWVKGKFIPWLDWAQDRCGHIVGVAGNHDTIFYKQTNSFKKYVKPKMNWHYLQDSSIVIDGYKIYGHPWTLNFCNWSFQGSAIDIAIRDNKIPDDVNILVTHGPPYGIMDMVENHVHMYDGNENILREYTGSKSLKEKVNGLTDLKLHVFGHIHAQGGVQKHWTDEMLAQFVNAGGLDENERPFIRVVELEKNEK